MMGRHFYDPFFVFYLFFTLFLNLSILYIINPFLRVWGFGDPIIGFQTCGNYVIICLKIKNRMTTS